MTLWNPIDLNVILFEAVEPADLPPELVEAWIATGAACRMPNGAHVLSLPATGTFRKVNVLDGPCRGRTGLVFREHALPGRP